ncbi:probable secreted protein [Leeuwenhoekiella blandensis MED217]|uniref:Probable secreted protein n=2 Tax=Leeuwenhoekiella TaxID=283735 RepID=A3XIT2_LEEBM|nr:probable secreted protein [Leeuwenhoekiella blandensis MED217]
MTKGIIFKITLFLSSYPMLSQEGSTATFENSSNQLKVLSYNIHHANPPMHKDSIDLSAIIQVIKDSDADLVALQEIDSDTQRSGSGNQAQKIGDALGMQVFFGKSIDFQNGAYGVAILSRFPIIASKVYKLPSKPETQGEPRVLALSLIQLPDAQTIWFASTHLDSQKEDTNRILQIAELLNITTNLNQPVLVAGDFNAVANSPVIASLDSVFTRTCSSCPPTIPVENPSKAIDFIAFKPKSFFRLNNHRVIDEHYASDHLPVFANFQW